MARLQFKVTFTNAQPGAPVEILSPSTEHVYPSAASSTAVGGKQLYLDATNSITVWSDAQTVTAQTVDGTGSYIQGTATTGSATITVTDGTAPTNPAGSAAYSPFSVAVKRHGATLAFLGDSITQNGSSPTSSVGALTAGAAAGATSIAINTYMASGQASTLAAGQRARIGSGSTAEWVILGAVTGTGPTYTITVPALAKTHPSGDEFYVPATFFSAQSWAFRACVESDQQLRFSGLYGHGGWTAEEIRDNYLPLILERTPKPDMCMVLLGTNDLAVETPAVWVPVVTGIWDSLIAAGIEPIGATIPPVTPAGTAQAAAAQGNLMLAESARQRGLLFVDLHAALVAPNNQSAYVDKQTFDLTHPSEYGAETISTALRAILSSPLPPGYAPRVAVQAPANPATGTAIWLLNPTNSLMLTTTGSGADIHPTGSNTTGIATTSNTVATAAAPSSGKGNAVTITRAAAATTDPQWSINVTNANASPANSLIPGNRYRLTYKIATSGLAAAYTASETDTTANSVVKASSSFQGFDARLVTTAQDTDALAEIKTWNRDLTGTVSMEFVLPVGLSTNTCELLVRLRGSAASTAYSVTLWEVTLVDLDVAGVPATY